MSATIFCCSSVRPYRPRSLDQEAKFTAFTGWAHLQKPPPPLDDGSASTINSALYAVQLVRQINYGPQESIRYFVPARDGSNFIEATEDDMVESNFEKLNSYKNFKCNIHNKFFEVNLYQKSPTQTHHWRSNLSRPSRDIDLAYRQKAAVKTTEGVLGAERGKLVDSETNPAFQDLLDSPLPVVKTHETAPKDPEQPGYPNITTLKRILRFLLPKVGQKLGSSRLVSLLCLDRASEELGLGLEFDVFWETELTQSNILLFFVDCFMMGDVRDLTVNLAEIEKVVIPAIRNVDLRRQQLSTGSARLHEIVKMALEYGRALDWVSVYGDGILRVFTSGPSEALLEHCRRKGDTLQQDRHLSYPNGNSKTDEKEDDRERWWPDDDDGNSDYGYNGSDHESMKDFTACDKECGYCGTCDY